MNKRLIQLLLILFIPALIISSCKKDEGDEDEGPANTPPSASFTIDPPTGNTNTEFSLDASASSDAETPADELMVRWDFNDDGTWDTQYSTTKKGTLSFQSPGDYTIRCEVKDGGGLTASTTKDITVNIGGNSGPTTPSDPDPENGSVGVNIETDLGWTSTDPNLDPVTFDVYFGTSQSPPLVSEGQEQDVYDPGTLQYGTTYYWKIVAHDDQGHTTDGPVWSFTTATQSFVCGDNFTDARDGKTYGSVQIGDQCWMAQNLNIGDRIDGSQDMSDNSVIEKYCYDDELANCETFGGLYQWNEMMQYAKKSTQGICPDGWHLPSIEEWQELEMELGMPEAQATASSGWQGSDEGDQLKSGGSSGFDALMGGNRSTSGAFTLGGLGTAFWSASQASTYNAKARSLDTDHSGINHTNYNKAYGQAVRCIKN